MYIRNETEVGRTWILERRTVPPPSPSIQRNTEPDDAFSTTAPRCPRSIRATAKLSRLSRSFFFLSSFPHQPAFPLLFPRPDGVETEGIDLPLSKLLFHSFLHRFPLFDFPNVCLSLFYYSKSWLKRIGIEINEDCIVENIGRLIFIRWRWIFEDIYLI